MALSDSFRKVAVYFGLAEDREYYDDDEPEIRISRPRQSGDRLTQPLAGEILRYDQPRQVIRSQSELRPGCISRFRSLCRIESLEIDRIKERRQQRIIHVILAAHFFSDVI